MAKGHFQKLLIVPLTTLATIILLIAPGSSIELQEPDDPLTSVTKANEIFATNIFKVLRHTPENLAYSPSLLSIALAMVRIGSRGETNAEIQRALGFSKNLSSPVINEGFSDFIQNYPDNDDDIIYDNVQRLYVPQPYKIYRSYLHSIKDDLHLPEDCVGTTQFGRSVTASQKINKWLKSRTHGRIPFIVSPDRFSSRTKLVHVSGVYFSGEWATKFRTSKISEQPFAVNRTTFISVPMMTRVGKLRFVNLRSLDASAVSIPYTGDRLTLIVLLPHDAFGFWNMEARMRNVSMDWIHRQMRVRTVELHLPKFNIESTVIFSNWDSSLEKLGLKMASSVGKHEAVPNFSKLSPNSTGLTLDQVIHKTVFEVTEDGVNSPSDRVKGSKEPPIIFRADHPFFAFLYDTETKAVLLVIKKIN